MTKISQNFETCLVFLISWGALEGHYIAHRFQADAFEDLLRARSCAEQNLCELSGASTTVPGIEQGALFSHFLAFLRGEGASIDQIWSLTFILLALAVTLLFVVLKRYMERGAALLGSVVALFVFLLSDIVSVLWNPSLQPLPTVLFFGCSLLAIEKMTFWRVVLLGLAMGLLVEVHPIGLIVIPVSLWFIAARHSSGWVGGLLCLMAAGIGGAVFFGISPRAASHLFQWFVSHLGGGAAMALLAAGLGSVWCLRRKVMAMERDPLAIIKEWNI